MEFSLSDDRGGNTVRIVEGGKPITYETGLELRKVVYGSSIHSFSSEYKHAGFTFQNIDGPFPYGLQTQRNGSRGVIMCVQAYLLKHQIFKYGTKDEIFSRNVLQPSSWEIQDALYNALCEIVWKAGDGKSCYTCLPQQAECFEPNTQYRRDGITEKLHIYEIRRKEDLKTFFKRNQTFFQGMFGCILFLYSVVLSRTVKRVLQDFGDDHCQLLVDNEDCSQAMVNLLLTGRASKYLHNGDVIVDAEDGHPSYTQKGVMERSDVGFLYWHKDEDDRSRTQVGSMLKTPKYPVWVTNISGQFGTMFSTNPELTRDWRSEHKFMLHYYVGLPTQKKNTILTVDTRFGRQAAVKSTRTKRDDEKRKIPAVEQCIMTKWYGAEVDWNGSMPFV